MTQTERRLYLIKELLREQPGYQAMDIPADIQEQKNLLCSLFNIFVLTTNVDHQFQLAGFDKKRLFYTQGDYGLWESPGR